MTNHHPFYNTAYKEETINELRKLLNQYRELTNAEAMQQISPNCTPLH